MLYRQRTQDLVAGKILSPRTPIGFDSTDSAFTWLEDVDLTDESICKRFNFAPLNSDFKSTLPELFRGKQEFSSTLHPRPQVNYCTNKKTQCSTWRPIGYVIPYGSYYGPYQLAFYASYIFKGFTTWGQYAAGELIPLVDTQSSARRAWWEMQPRFKSDAQMLVSLVELKDFKDIASNLTKLINKLRLGEYGRWYDIYSLYRKEDIPAHVLAQKTMAGGTLLYNLAIQPLLKDIAALTVAMQTAVHDARSVFNEMGAKPHTTHYTEVLDYQTDIVYMSSNSIEGMSKKLTFVASMERTYSVVPTNAYNDFLQYYGLGFSFEALWNLLPFSFIADYVLRIGDSIRRMEIDKTVDLLPLSYYESILSESHQGTHMFNSGLRYTLDGQECHSANKPVFLGGYTNSYYNRYPASPNYGPALPNFAKYRDKALINCIAILRTMF